MTKEQISKYSFLVNVGTAISVILFIGFGTWNGAFKVASAENIINLAVSTNTSRIDAIEDKFQTQQNYLYNLKSDLKADIKATDDKIDKIIDLLLKK